LGRRTHRNLNPKNLNRLKREWGKGDAPEFGAAYLYALQDTVTGEVGESAGSREFLVKSDAFRRVAAEYGLEPAGQPKP
jgi:hypothetical protein